MSERLTRVTRVISTQLIWENKHRAYTYYKIIIININTVEIGRTTGA